MTTSDDLPAALWLLGGGVAGFALGRVVLSRVLDERERATAPTAVIAAGRGPLAASSTALIDPYAEPAVPPAANPAPATAAGSTTSPNQIATRAPAASTDPYPVTAPGTVPPMTKPARVPAEPPLSRAFDPVFETYRGSIPIEFLRALCTRESDMNPAERSGPAWGLMQIVEAVRLDYNRAHRTRYRREDLLDPCVNVAIGCWLLRTIIKSYAKHHPDVPNLRADWDNVRFAELLIGGWNAGFSEKAGVGYMATYLKAHSLAVNLDNVHQYAELAAASRHLQNAKKVRWCKGVAALYLRERDHAARAPRTVA